MLGIGLNLVTTAVREALYSRLIPTTYGSQYGQRAAVYVANAGDKLKIKFATTSSGVSHYLSDGDSASNRAAFLFAANDTVNWDETQITGIDIDGSAATDTVTAVPNDGKEHTAILTLAAGARVSVLAANYLFGSGFLGQIFEHQFTTLGVVQDPVVWDSGSILYQLQRGTSLGDELTTQSNFIVDASVTDNGDGTYDCASGAGVTLLRENGILTANKYIQVKFTVTNYVSGTVVVNVSGDSSTSLSANDTSTQILLPTGTNWTMGSGAGGFEGTLTLEISNTAKQLPDTAVLFTNFTLSNWAKYTKLRNYQGVALGWWAGELVDNVTASAWYAYPSNTIVDEGEGIVKITSGGGAEGAYIYLNDAEALNADLVAGKIYMLYGSAKVNTGLVRINVVGGTEDITSTDYIPFAIAFVSLGAAAHFIRAESMNAGESIWLKDLSVKELIEVA